MKTTIVVLVLVLAGLVAPSPGAAIYPFCPDCSDNGMGPNCLCTCPGTGPHPYWRFSTCGTYPAGCLLEESVQPDSGVFLSTLTKSSEVPANASNGTSPLCREVGRD